MKKTSERRFWHSEGLTTFANIFLFNINFNQSFDLFTKMKLEILVLTEIGSSLKYDSGDRCRVNLFPFLLSPTSYDYPFLERVLIST